MASIQGVYVALFGRPADPAGLAYFNTQTNGGADLTAIGDLSASQEYTDRFAGQTPAQIVNAIYMSLFGRSPELAGLNFFTEALTNGTLTAQNIAIAILDGAQGADKTTVDLKIAAADAFTAAIDTTAEVLAYSGAGAVAQGVAFISGVTTTAPTAAEVDAAVAGVVAGGGAVGSTFTLTVGVDEGTKFTGTANDDTFRAVTALSLEDSDILDGAGGNDVLNISAGGMGAATVAPVIKNIERINNADTDTLNLAGVTGAGQIWSSAAGVYTNADAATIFGAEKMGAGTTVSIDYAAASPTAAKLAVNNTDAAGDATFDFGADAATITSVDVMAVKGNKGDAILDADLDALKTVTASGDGEVTVVSAETTIESVNSSANTGGLTFDASAATALKTMTGGSGKDVFTAADQTKLVIDLGAGSDALTLGGANAGSMVTLGAGNDKLTFADLDNMTDVTEAGFAATIIKVADFSGSDDTIDVTNAAIGARDVLTNVELADIADEATLFAAVTKAATFTDTGAESYSTFVYGGNTYIYNDSSDTQLLAAGDGLVELTGFTGDLTAVNFLA